MSELKAREARNIYFSFFFFALTDKCLIKTNKMTKFVIHYQLCKYDEFCITATYCNALGRKTIFLLYENIKKVHYLGT